MHIKPRTKTHKHITVWIPHEQLSALDEHLAREVARIPGARVSRHGWVAALVARELAAIAQPSAEVQS